ncbi:hypothetical protein L484_015388 [Morus notabilis]|uniref:Uncharacterized protein n=1 Tax=Morus notabilis TaxID=981085 RepID=W9RFU5_9ROSA|nr:hypothetical protein L484_015388 [Morus notabilis]
MYRNYPEEPLLSEREQTDKLRERKKERERERERTNRDLHENNDGNAEEPKRLRAAVKNGEEENAAEEPKNLQTAMKNGEEPKKKKKRGWLRWLNGDEPKKKKNRYSCYRAGPDRAVFGPPFN